MLLIVHCKSYLYVITYYNVDWVLSLDEICFCFNKKLHDGYMLNGGMKDIHDTDSMLIRINIIHSHMNYMGIIYELYMNTFS